MEEKSTKIIGEMIYTLATVFGVVALWMLVTIVPMLS